MTGFGLARDALKAKIRTDCEPIGVLAQNISAVDQLQIEGLGRSPAQTDLSALVCAGFAW